ncbi:MAG: two-component regulator propeller domain-containing protein [Candidatus Marinimicrobia bacterium]|nr:two-component regulator propeller domain-containing protein [Candidatus Neomarinimicrobiota bacterium]
MFLYRLLLLLVISITCYTQENPLKFDHLTVEDGLSQGAVHAIYEDSKGFMWFGTRFGLNRYDGYQFKYFNHDPIDSTSLPGYRVLTLLEDHETILWVGTENGGLAKYNRDTERFNNFSHDRSDTSSLSSNQVTCLFEDSDQMLWIGTQNGLNRFNSDRQRFTRYYHIEGDDASLPANHVSAISEISPGTLLIGMGNGSVAAFDRQSHQFTNIKNEEFWPSNSSARVIESILKDREHDYVWVSRFTYGLTKFNLNDGTVNHYDPANYPDRISTDYIFSISQDQTGKLWMATVGGVTVFDPLTEQFTYHRNDDTNPTSINDKIILSVFIDKQGLVWAGSESKGISIYKPNQIRFEQFNHESGNTQGPSGNGVYSFDEDETGDIWFTTLPGGTNRYDPVSGDFRYYQSDDSKRGVWSMTYAMQVMIDQFGMVWIGTAVAGLSQVDPQSGQRLHLYHNSKRPNSLSGHSVHALLESSKGTIWVGTQDNGLNRFNREANNFSIYQHDPGDSSSISGNCIMALLEDQDSVLWIGTTQGGLNRYDPETESFTAYKHSPNNSNSPGSNSVLALYEDTHNNLWIGTRGGGLNKLDPTRKQFSILDLGFENTDIIIYSIQEDDHGFLWLSTNDGLMKADPEKGFLNRYTRDDGLQGNEFLYGSSLRDKKGFMYFGGANGFNRFHPDSILNNPHIPPVVITDFKINYVDVPIGEMSDGRRILTRSITETQAITIGHQDKTISFTYAALDFSDPQRNRYAYKLDNFNEDWIQAGSDNDITYTSLEPGDYVFHVKASNNDGLWNEAGVSLAITVLPPFWETWWFRLLTSLILILMVFVYVRLRIKRVEAEKRKLQKLVKERTAELKVEIEERQKVETEKMQLKVDHLKRELVSKSICATEKQEIMNNLFKELKDIQKMDANEMRKRFNGVVRYFKNLFISDQDWDEFEKWFTEVHPDFFENLRQNHSELSQREVKVCALLRLNLSSKEIANLLNVQLNTVEIYRHRIRKKIGLTQKVNLSHYFAEF